MRKYELTISKDYVPKWTVVDAVRELFQNALDQQTTVEGNEMFFDYDPEDKTLHIGNKSSVLNVSTLLLGSSTKRNDPDTIGQFGEGYKIATLVLTRLDKKVIFYNYGAKEVWLPRFVKSRRYGTDILTFFVDKKYIWQKVPDNNLTIVVDNITPEEYQEIVDSNLHCQDVGRTLDNEYGRILLEGDYRGQVFVNGLFVCNHMKYEYGYDFKPQHMNIDRDRKLANTFDLEWLSSKMWGVVDSELTTELIKNGSADVAHIPSTLSYYRSDHHTKITSNVLNEFKSEHGDNAVPVTTQEEYDQVKKKYKPVFVNHTYSSIIKESDDYIPPKTKRITPKMKLEEWLKNHKQVLTKKAIGKLKAIIDEVKE